MTLFADHDVPRGARFLTERELIRALGLSRTTLWRLRKEGLPTLSVGRSIRYDVEKVEAWIEKYGEANAEPLNAPNLEVRDGLAECHWSLAVALDPKHRPQEPTRPSSTARREWWRYPQEAHLLDRVAGRYRRLVASEVAEIQGFPASWGRRAVQDELLLLRGYGDAVPPPLAQVVFSWLPELLGKGTFEALEVCAGFGGLALGGARAQNVRHVALLERWDVACEVLRSCGMFDPETVHETDLKDVDWEAFAGRIDLLTGGPPCQPWSQAGKGFGAEDERDLLGMMPAVVAQVRPRGFVFENVPGLLSGENETYARELIERFRHAAGSESYGVALATFNAADFGVPQVRRRVFIVGARGRTTADLYSYFDAIFSSRTHADPRSAWSLGLSPWRKIADAVTNWEQPKALWRRWPIARVEGETEEVSEEITTTDSSRSPSARVRLGLDWPSRGFAVEWKAGVWSILAAQDSTASSRSVPLIPDADMGDPIADPWLILGDPCLSLDGLRRQIGRETRLVYVDLPRIRTNAGAFDAADRDRVLDTWLSVSRAVLRRAAALLEDRGAIAVLCGIEETTYARLLLDEFFGHQNHLGTVAWQKGYSPRNMPNMREFSPVHDNILLFARRLESLHSISLRLPQTGFSNRDNDPRGPWKAEQKGANKPDCDYEVHVCPYRWEVAKGSLPPGLWRINPKSGVIWGGPTDVGIWNFTIRVTDRLGAATEKDFELVVSVDAASPASASIPWLVAGRDASGRPTGGPDKNGELRILTASLPAGRLNALYSTCIVAAGGSPWVGITRPGKTSSTGKGRYWEFPSSTLLARAAEDAVDFKSKDDAIPTPKVYANGEDRRLNQTTLWFGRARPSVDEDDEGDPTDVDYSQDAKKELAALQKTGVVSAVTAVSKPSKLMARLLALFTDSNSTIVDIGSPAAEMAAIATAAGRKAVYVGLTPDEGLARDLWIPRLRLAARGMHPLPTGLTFSATRAETDTGYILDGRPRERRSDSDVFLLRPGHPFCKTDAQLGSISIDYVTYPAGSKPFLSALASVEGMVPLSGHTGPFAQSRNGRVICLYVSSSEWLDRSTVDALAMKFQNHLDNGGSVRIYFHRGPADPDRIGDHRIELRRIPFALLVAAGMT